MVDRDEVAVDFREVAGVDTADAAVAGSGVVCEEKPYARGG